MNITRRTALAGAAASAAALTLPATSLRAAAPPAGKQAPGFYRYKVGDLELTQIHDGARTFPLPDSFVKNVSKEDVNKALESLFMPRDQMTITFSPVAVNSGSKLTLIDTGNGPQAQANVPVGLLASNLAASGIDAKNVDIVVISHFHGDHIGGLRTADGGLAFPNAEIKVPAAEWAFWMSDENMNKAPEAARGGFMNARRVFKDLADKVTKYEGDKEVAPGVTAIATPGHTPGHTSFVISSGSNKMLVQSDITNHPGLFATNPGWHLVFDMDAAQAEATRRKFFDMAAADKLRVAGYHYPFPAVGNVEKAGNGYRVTPVMWSPTL
jgi:glyoxylase-like metal-dependent hydrolase (beta-lactamase superfamily II)